MIRPSAGPVTAVSVVLTIFGVQACRPAAGTGANDVMLGAEARLGDGTVTSFARFDSDGTPLAIGVIFSAAALESPPTELSDEHECFDLDGDGVIQPDAECIPTHERVIPLPGAASRRPDMPIKWVLLNWNPAGHIPPGIYDVPHFDLHFYIESIENTFALKPGPCGPEKLRCDQFELAIRPVPSNFTHPDFADLQAAVPAMGNHLIDTTGAELHGTPFTRSWIYGTYDGRITFWEEMVTLEYLNGRPDTCYDIKQPEAVEIAGYYPTQSCYHYDVESDAQSVSLEGFVYREASPPVATMK